MTAALAEQAGLLRSPYPENTEDPEAGKQEKIRDEGSAMNARALPNCEGLDRYSGTL